MLSISVPFHVHTGEMTCFITAATPHAMDVSVSELTGAVLTRRPVTKALGGASAHLQESGLVSHSSELDRGQAEGPPPAVAATVAT